MTEEVHANVFQAAGDIQLENVFLKRCADKTKNKMDMVSVFVLALVGKIFMEIVSQGHTATLMQIKDMTERGDVNVLMELTEIIKEYVLENQLADWMNIWMINGIAFVFLDIKEIKLEFVSLFQAVQMERLLIQEVSVFVLTLILKSIMFAKRNVMNLVI